MHNYTDIIAQLLHWDRTESMSWLYIDILFKYSMHKSIKDGVLFPKGSM